MANRMGHTAEHEARREVLQATLDDGKTRRERNRLGQFATPPALARSMLREAVDRLGSRRSLRFLDPAIGTGAFYSALLQVAGQRGVERAVGYEVDPHYGLPAKRLWAGTGIDLRLEDFTKASPATVRDQCDLLICNPPYVRHHHLAGRQGEKRRLSALVRQASGMELSGLAGLYCYFIGLAHRWLADDGLAGWLIPTEFMDVVYGEAVKRYLLDEVTLLRIHRFDAKETQFADALVSSAIVWYRKRKPPAGHRVAFTFGGSLERPATERMVAAADLRGDGKWTRHPTRARANEVDTPRLSSFFAIKRGQVTGDNAFFILSEDEVAERELPPALLRPLLPSPRHLAADEVAADQDGHPRLNRRLFLLDCRLPEETVRDRHPALWRYLQEGKARGVSERYLCRGRNPWYMQERRPPTALVCTYIGRLSKRTGKPFRFILNHSQATVANVYLLLYPHAATAHALRGKPALVRRVWQALRDIPAEALLAEGRVYGGGLHKIEPRELGNVPAPALAAMLPQTPDRHSRSLGRMSANGQAELFGQARG